MRNLKRALSMAMASVMLMGMSVVGTSAASVSDFSDVDSINNLEAVSIATGLGIFDGYDDGEFKPEKVVTRAEMAVVIAKILHGADVDPSIFVGDSKFTDVPAWAEGYVNLCDSLGIIEGYGDGKFGPNDPVTTVQANIMLLKALGYYTSEGDNLPANWADAQLQATSKATALGFFGDKALKMDQGLTREDVAELTFNALFAQRVAYDDVRGLHVKANDRNVVVTNGTIDSRNTLAENTFGLYAVEGVVVANGMTSKKLSESVKSEAQTRVMFTEATDLNQDGKAEKAEGDWYDFEVETGLDMIGHAAKVYYKIDKKVPVVYAMVDEATLTAQISYSKNSTVLADAANEAGFKKDTILDINVDNYVVNYDFGVEIEDAVTDGKAWSNGDAIYVNANDQLVKSAMDNTGVAKDLILISNSGNKNVDYVIVLDQYLDSIEKIDTDADITEYDLTLTGTNTITVDEVAEKDYVMVTNIGLDDTYYAFEKATVQPATITTLAGKTNTAGDITKVTADGEDYTKSKVYANTAAGALNELVAFSNIKTIGETKLVLDNAGKLIAIVDKKEIPNYAYIAEYGVRHSTGSLNTKDVLTAKVYFADGTNGVYEVDLKDSTALFLKDGTTKIPVATFEASAANAEQIKKDLNNNKTVDTVQPADLVDTTTAGTIAQAARGLYDVEVQADNTILIKPIVENITADTTANITGPNIKLVNSHSTILNVAGTPVNVETIEYDGDGDGTPSEVGEDELIIYNNNETVYFYIDCDTAGGNLVVKTITGIKNAKGFTNDVNTYDAAKQAETGIKQAFTTKVGKRAVVDTMLITCVELGDAANIYYHDENGYSVTGEAGKYTLTYTLYEAKTGEAYEVTYDNNGKYWATFAAAQAVAKAKYDGWYTLGTNDLIAYAAVTVDTNADGVYDDFAMLPKGTVTYITNDDANYDEYVDNLFGDQSKLGAILDQDTVKVVDICNSNLTSVSKLVNAIKNDGAVDISFTWNENYETFVIFVTAYDPDSTPAPGGDDSSIYGFSIADMNVSNNGSDLLKIETSKILVNNVASNASDGTTDLTAGTLTVSVGMVNGGSIVNLGTQTIKNVTFDDGALTDSLGNAYVVIPGIGIATGNTYQITLTFSNGAETFSTVYIKGL